MTKVDFGDLFTFIRNGMNVKQDKSGDGIPISRIETIADATIDSKRVGYAGLSEDACDGWLLEPGDILFSHINSVEHVGKCAVFRGNPPRLVHGMNLLCLRPDRTKIEPEFAKYLIRSIEFRSRLSGYINKAVNQASVSIGNLKTIPVEIPTIPEQRRIADILDRADTLRAKRRAALARLDELTQAIFVEMFGDPVKNPKRWPEANLDDMLIAIRNGANAEQNEEIAGWPITRIETIADGTINPNRVRWIDPDESLIDNFQLDPGDILFSHINSVEHIAKTAIYTGSPTRLIHGINLLRLRPRTQVVDPVWLLHLLKHESTRTYFRTRCKRAVNQASLNQPDIKCLKVYLPPLPLQSAFSRTICALARLKTVNVSFHAAVNRLFASLQDRAFRGAL